MITTKRLIMRPFKITDQDFLFELNNNKDTNRYRSTDSVSMEYCVDSILDWNEKYGDGLLNVYLIELKEIMEPIGLIGIFKYKETSMAELGYRLLPEYWGMGYCSEALKDLITMYFNQTDESEIFAETHHENTGSIKLLNRNGFIEEEHKMQNRGRIFITKRDVWI